MYAPKCKDTGPWTYILKSLKTYQQNLEVHVNCFYFSASNEHRYQTREAKARKYIAQHFAYHFSPLSSSLITPIVISLWLVVLDLVNWIIFKKGSLSSSKAIRFAAIALFIMQFANLRLILQKILVGITVEFSQKKWALLYSKIDYHFDNDFGSYWSIFCNFLLSFSVDKFNVVFLLCLKCYLIYRLFIKY